MTVIGSYQVWPEGLTWVFQGTVAEDATAGTHICTLTVTPGAGNEMQVLYGMIIDGATATAQNVAVFIDDGTNKIVQLVRAGGATTTSAEFDWPNANPSATTGMAAGPVQIPIVSGTMRLVLQVSTAAVSVTQTFAVACRIKGSAPTAVLLDTIGTSTNTINTNKVFG